MTARAIALLIWLLVGSTCKTFAGTPDPINPIPVPGASYQSQMDTFLKNEDADRFNEMFTGFVFAGCLGTTGAGLTHTPTACTAYPAGYRITETGAITYPDNGICWVIANKAITGNLTSNVTFTRVANTHYLTNCTVSTPPTLPTGAVYLMKVLTAGGSITSVLDRRQLTPVLHDWASCLDPTQAPYYADKTGVTDTTLSFQAALDAGFAAGRPVCPPPGLYKIVINTGASPRRALTIKGQLICQAGATFNCDTSAIAANPRACLAIGDDVTALTRPVIDGCKIDGFMTNPTDLAEWYFGITVLAGPGITMTDVTITNNVITRIHGDGINMGQVGTPNGRVTGADISHNQVDHALGQCMTTGCGGGSTCNYMNIRVNDNWCRDCAFPYTLFAAAPECFIFSPGTHNLTFNNNHCLQWGQIGFDGVDGLIANGNQQIGANADAKGMQGGLVFNDVTNAVVVGNLVDISNYQDLTNGPAGLFGGGDWKNIVIDDLVIKRTSLTTGTTSGIGIAADVIQNLTLNNITETNGFSSATFPSPNAQVRVLTDKANSYGLTISNSHFASVGAGLYIIDMLGGRTHITDNDVRNSGIVLFGGDNNIVEGNTTGGIQQTLSSEFAGLVLLDSSNSVVKGNFFQSAATTATAWGIRIRCSAAGKTAVNNLIEGNTLSLPNATQKLHMGEATSGGCTNGFNRWINNFALEASKVEGDTFAATSRFVDFAGAWAVARLPAAAADGSLVFCSDCNTASPCAGGSTGFFALRKGGVWACNAL